MATDTVKYIVPGDVWERDLKACEDEVNKVWSLFDILNDKQITFQLVFDLQWWLTLWHYLQAVM